ncbi:MAG: DNA polymerase III subunit delta' [Candidatus Omnitrophota bacterium]
MSFNSIIGQENAVRALKGIIKQDQVSGSYLFLGPDGVGKRAAAIEFAKAVNCQKGEPDACDGCASCGKIISGNHPDIFMIEREDGASHIKIEKIRDIIYQASMKPYEGRKKVFIIRDAEVMTEEASNALLKILEEPPQNHVLILTTAYLSGMLPTVLSRCRVLKFNLVGQSRIQEFLVRDRGFTEEEAVLYSHAALGSPGRAIAFKEKNLLAERDRVLNDFFFRKRALFKEEVLGDKNYPDAEESLGMLLCWYRDLLVSKFTDKRELFFNIDKSNDIASYSQRFGYLKLEKDINSIMTTLGYIRGNVNQKTAFFNMALELERQ